MKVEAGCGFQTYFFVFSASNLPEIDDSVRRIGVEQWQ